jgi:hypothetical protein
MDAKALQELLVKKYPELVDNKFPYPLPFLGARPIKAILMGADPTHIIDKKPVYLTRVFGLDLKYSPYFNRINSNLNKIEGLTKDNLYIQNVCRNFFKRETNDNPKWEEIARKYWLPFLKDELDNLFEKEIPVLITTEFILKASLYEFRDYLHAPDIYSNCKTFPKESNLLQREIIALYRHQDYSLSKKETYNRFLSLRFKD